MTYCTKCGNVVPDNARFCSKCGTPVSAEQAAPADSAVAQPQPVAEKAPKEPKKPVDFTKFNKIFWMLYIITGVCSYLLVEVTAAYVGVSNGFAITLGVLALITVAAFCATGIVRFISFFKESEENKVKYRLCNSICLALSIIMFVFVLLATIAMFVQISNLTDIPDAIKSMFGG